MRGRARRAIFRASEVAQRLSYVAVAVVAGAFGGLLFHYLPEASMSGIAAAIFGAAGTIVALVLPAAELAGHSITRVADYWLNRYYKPERMPPPASIALIDLREIKRRARTAQQGSAYVLYAFVFAGFALPTPHVSIGPQTFHAEHALLGLACGFLLVGSALFFPFAWAVYRLDDLSQAEALIGKEGDKLRAQYLSAQAKALANEEADPTPPPPRAAGAAKQARKKNKGRR